jgi:membrane protein YdbS with pleckstrin-like domain
MRVALAFIHAPQPQRVEIKKEMNKKVNTLLFVLGATVFNILVTIVLFVVLFFLCFRFLPESIASGALPFIFIVSLVVSFFTYNAVLKFVTTKVDMDKYFDPIFKSRRKR